MQANATSANIIVHTPAVPLRLQQHVLTGRLPAGTAAVAALVAPGLLPTRWSSNDSNATIAATMFVSANIMHAVGQPKLLIMVLAAGTRTMLIAEAPVVAKPMTDPLRVGNAAARARGTARIGPGRPKNASP